MNMRIRRTVSLSLLLALLLQMLTGIVLFIVPQGRVAYWVDWRLWGLTKNQWGDLHVNLGILMIVVGLIHLYYNWKPVLNYLRNKAREIRVFTLEFNVAMSCCLLVVVATLAGIPPMVWVQDLGASIKGDAAERLGEPPYGHAEESGLRALQRNVGLDQGVAEAYLKAAGVEISDPNVKTLDLARSHGLSPSELFEIMQGPEGTRSREPKPISETMPRGAGRQSLAEFCSSHNRDLTDALAVLTAAGLRASGEGRLKDIAEANDMGTRDLLDLLREGLVE